MSDFSTLSSEGALIVFGTFVRGRRDLSDRLSETGADYRRAAENIAWGYATPEAVLAGWLDSSGHRANIENCSLTEHGVGLFQTRWTHLFRTP